ncbi:MULTISPECIES: hypothetical protein [Flavobacterium]|uniref:Uncharacterized protein n=1 Tax=Flavobacterium hankyongi TaxID=1176532 RepID=A0ABP8ZJ51_9FLAO|nr:hypothetical protein [Flavobacterium sp. N1846]
MKKDYPKYYWIFILILQSYLVFEKIKTDKFYLWNVIALIASIVFLYHRVRLNKTLINSEKTIVLMIIINGITSTITNFILNSDILRIITTILITIISIIIGNSIKDTEKNTK